MSAIHIQSTLDRLGNLLRNDLRQALHQYGLQPVQFEALYYLANCNRYSDTAMAVTEYLGQTKGTVSQSLKILEREGLINKHIDQVDKRVGHLVVSAKGRKLIAKVLPSMALKRGLDNLTKNEVADIEEKTKFLLTAMQIGNKLKTFGQCASCIHNQKKNGQTVCGITKEILSNKDTTLICREHQ